MPGILAEAVTSGLLKVGHRQSYQEQMKSKLASTHLVRFTLHTIAATWCKINEASERSSKILVPDKYFLISALEERLWRILASTGSSCFKV